MMTPEHTELARHGVDFLSLGIVVGALVDLLPSIATLLSIIWLLIQISQSARFAQLVGWCRRKLAWPREH